MIAKTLHKTLLAAGLLAGLGFGAVAQTAAPAAPAPQAQAQSQAAPQAHRGDRARMEQRHAKHREMRQVRAERRLAALKLKLQISGAQDSAWTTWTSAMKPTPRQRPDRAEIERLTTPERIDRMRAMRTARIADMDRRGEATKALYATLNPDQQKVFDGESLRFGKGGKQGRGGKGGHQGHHGHHGHHQRG